MAAAMNAVPAAIRQRSEEPAVTSPAVQANLPGPASAHPVREWTKWQRHAIQASQRWSQDATLKGPLRSG